MNLLIDVFNVQQFVNFFFNLKDAALRSINFLAHIVRIELAIAQLLADVLGRLAVFVTLCSWAHLVRQE